jgi:DNA repair protein RecO (recombination protein O)
VSFRNFNLEFTIATMIKTRGIVFRNQKYSESSVIADIYTEEKGLQSYIFSGVRKQKARTSAGLLQILSLVDLVAYDRDDRSLNRVKEIKPAFVYQSIPFDVQKSAVGMFLIEVTRKSIQGVEQNRPLFSFLYERLQLLDRTQASVANFHLDFLMRLATYLGFQPSGSYEESTPYFDLQEGCFTDQVPGHVYYLKDESSEIMGKLLAAPEETWYQGAISRPLRKVLLQEVLNYYRLHVDHLPEIHAHTILEAVLG